MLNLAAYTALTIRSKAGMRLLCFIMLLSSAKKSPTIILQHREMPIFPKKYATFSGVEPDLLKRGFHSEIETSA